MENLGRKIASIVVERGKFILRSGKESEHYLDMRRLYAHPDLFNDVVDALWFKANQRTTCVIGKGLGGIPLASVMASRHKVKLCAIRDEQKGYGLQKQIEGYTPNRMDVVTIVDDVFTTGSSMKEARDVLQREKNVNIAKYVAVVNREEGDPNSLGGEFDYLFTGRELLRYFDEERQKNSIKLRKDKIQ
mgnify:CR=1 FL=1